MPNLFPQGYEEQLAAVSDIERDEPVGYKPSAAFSFETGDFVRNGANQVESASGVEAWEAWCRICLMTPRYSHAAYTTDFGVEIEQAFKANTRAEAESILTRQITEALSADPYGRTAYVSNITYTWTAADEVTADVHVVGINDVTIDISVPLSGGGY